MGGSILDSTAGHREAMRAAVRPEIRAWQLFLGWQPSVAHSAPNYGYCRVEVHSTFRPCLEQFEACSMELGVRNMTTTNFGRFLSDCIAADPSGDQDRGLAEDEMYGLYVSWCTLSRQAPEPCGKFWTAMSGLGHTERHRIDSHYVRPGLRMTGPAAVDYILASRPSLV